MTFKDLMVHVESGAGNFQRSQYAVAFAAAHQAHLTAIAFAPNAIVPTYGEPGIIAPLPQSYFDDLKIAAQQALDMIAQEAGHAGVAIETRLIEGMAGDLPQLLSVEARWFDLTIFGQPRGDALWSNRGEAISRLLMTSGRPVLIVPHTGAVYAGIDTVLAAWDGSAEASRSLHDAMPLLAGARRVLLYVGDADERRELHGDLPGADIARHLARHGVTVDARAAHSDELSIGELLLNRAENESAALIVMGGFHHSRLRELLIGGVTKTVLEQMSVPVFMSH